MPSETEEFFVGKRPWSKVKDRILSSYMSPYVAKITRLSYPLLLIDAFAGPGKFDDGLPGSPLIMCQAAKRYADGKYKAIFVNSESEYHSQLEAILKKGNWHPDAMPILGDSKDLLREIAGLLTNQSVFLYLDPFGLKDCNFDILRQFLQRSKVYSTEIVVNLCAPALHRLAGRDAINKGTISHDLVESRHKLLTRTLGGDYWKEALLSEGIETKKREQMIVEGYMQQLASTGYLKYTGYCPILESRESATKYYMIFASPHPDAMVLFNDAMFKAYNEYMTQRETAGTLFADLHWTLWRDTSKLVELAIQYVNRFPGKTRKALWTEIVIENFMQFSEKEYRNAVNQAVDQNLIHSPTPRKTKRLNDDCVLMPGRA